MAQGLTTDTLLRQKYITIAKRTKDAEPPPAANSIKNLCWLELELSCDIVGLLAGESADSTSEGGDADTLGEVGLVSVTAKGAGDGEGEEGESRGEGEGEGDRDSEGNNCWNNLKKIGWESSSLLWVMCLSMAVFLKPIEAANQLLEGFKYK